MTAGRFTADEVRAIRASAEKGTALAARYGVTPAMICRIRRGEAYHAVTDTCDGARHRGKQGRLSEGEVRDIRSSLEPVKAIARRYGMTSATISMIRSRKSYAWVSDE